MNAVLERIAPAWNAVEEMTHIGPIRDAAHYDEMLALMDMLTDEIGEDEHHPLAGLLFIVGDLIYAYDEANNPIPESTGVELLEFLMDQHGLRQSDLSEIGSQGVVSEVLSGRRSLNIRQAHELSRRFNLPMECFV